MHTAQSLPNGGTLHFNVSTQYLDMVDSRFQQQAPVLGLWGVAGIGSSPVDYLFGPSTTGLRAAAASVEFGSYLKSFPIGLTMSWPQAGASPPRIPRAAERI